MDTGFKPVRWHETSYHQHGLVNGMPVGMSFHQAMAWKKERRFTWSKLWAILLGKRG